MKTRKKSTLSVAERVDSAIGYLMSGSSPTPVTVSKVCELAGVNRSNLYAHYPEMTEKIRSLRAKQVIGRARPQRSEQVLLDEIKSLKKKLKVMTYACIELQLALKNSKDDLKKVASRKKNQSTRT